MNGRTAKRLLVALLLCLQLGSGLPAAGMRAATQGAPTAATPHCAHAMSAMGGASQGGASLHELSAQSIASGQTSHRSNHAGCCVEAGCSCACLVAAFPPQPTLYAAASVQAIPLPLSIGALPRHIESSLRPPI